MKSLNLLLFLLFFITNNHSFSKTNMSIYDFSFTDIDGNLVNLENFKGKPLLIFNSASKCGFTSQYSGIQKIHEDYKRYKSKFFVRDFIVRFF